MSALAPTIEAFFTERLISQRQASPRTITSYRDTLRMLLAFAHHRTGKAPSNLDVADVDVTLVSAFLTHLEHDRHNSARTRNTRLAAIRSLFSYAALRHPEHAHSIQLVLAIPTKRHVQRDVDYLQPEEVDALLAVADHNTWLGRRDPRAARAAGPDRAAGQRAVPPHLWQRSARIRGACQMSRETPQGTGDPIDDPHRGGATQLDDRTSRRGDRTALRDLGRTTLSADAVQWLVAKHARTAAHTCPSLAAKTVSPTCCATPAP